MFCLFDALSPSQQFFSHVATISCLPGLSSTKLQILVKCFSKGHNTVTPHVVSLKLASLMLYQLDHSTPLEILVLRPNKKISVFRVTGLKTLSRVGTHIFFLLYFFL